MGSLLVLLFFFCGVFTGWMTWLPQSWAQSDASTWVLYFLLFGAGMGVGFDLKALAIIRQLKGRILLLPLAVVFGTLAGSTLARYSGERYAVLAVFSGMSLTLLVPVLVPLLLSLR